MLTVYLTDIISNNSYYHYYYNIISNYYQYSIHFIRNNTNKIIQISKSLWMKIIIKVRKKKNLVVHLQNFLYKINRKNVWNKMDENLWVEKLLRQNIIQLRFYKISFFFPQK